MWCSEEHVEMELLSESKGSDAVCSIIFINDDKCRRSADIIENYCNV